jgi:hypothetical protein
MEFRLIYKGSLRSAQAKHRVAEKHKLRKRFHCQLAELWSKEPILNRALTGCFAPIASVHRGPTIGTIIGATPPEFVSLEHGDPKGRPYTEYIADDYARCGFRFIPLIRKKNGFTCGLDILFLRRGHPGEVVVSGDLDNRLKTLIDGLKMPGECSEIGSLPTEGEAPFFCLLEDDSLITSMKVTTDRLLTPIETDEGKWDVELVIHVTVIDPAALLGNAGLP